MSNSSPANRRSPPAGDAVDTVRARLRRLGWTAFVLVGLAYVLSFFHRFAPAAIAADLQQEFLVSATALGALASSYFYVYTVMQIPTGILVDTVGPRRIVAVGGVIAAIGSLLFALAGVFGWVVVGRLLIGLGVSVTFIALLKLNAAWFHERHFGTMAGMTILIGNLGAVLAASPLNWVLGLVSWRTVFVVVALVSLLLAVAAWRWVRDTPHDAGLPSPRELAGEEPHPQHGGAWRDGLREVLANRATWPGLFVNLGVSGSFFAFAGLWVIPLLNRGYGFERAVAAHHATTLLLGFAVGALLLGVVSDRLGRRKPVLVSAALLHLVCWLPLLGPAGWLTGNSFVSFALFLLMGLGAAGFTLTWACAKEVNRHALSGMATSVVNVGGFLGAAILQPLAGWAIDRAAAQADLSAIEIYQAGVVVLATAAAAGALASLTVRETWCRYQEVGKE